MADIAHATLTGSDLHEPKGIDTAADGEVYIADGAASGNWTDSATVNPFGTGLLQVRNQQTSGTVGASFSSLSWQTRVLNTVVTNNISGSSLAANQLTLPIGEYMAMATASIGGDTGPSNNIRGKLRFRNITGSATLLVGQNQTFNNWNSGVLSGSTSQNIGGVMNIEGQFSLAGVSLVELQAYVGPGTLTNGNQGDAITSGEVEVYADIKIWKLS